MFFISLASSAFDSHAYSTISKHVDTISAVQYNDYDILYSKKPQTEFDILDYAEKEGLDINKLKIDVMSKKVNDQLQAELKLAHDNKLNATPSLQIGLRIIPGVTPYSELEKILLDAGAKKR